MSGCMPAVHALKRLHAELGGKIKDNRREAKRLAENMKHVEAVLKMLQPGFDTRAIAPRRRNKQASPYKRGEVFRAVLDVLRTADGPLTSREISEALWHRAGVGKPTLPAIRSMVGAVHTSLRNHRGTTVQNVGQGIPVRWELIKEP